MHARSPMSLIENLSFSLIRVLLITIPHVCFEDHRILRIVAERRLLIVAPSKFYKHVTCTCSSRSRCTTQFKEALLQAALYNAYFEAPLMQGLVVSTTECRVLLGQSTTIGVIWLYPSSLALKHKRTLKHAGTVAHLWHGSVLTPQHPAHKQPAAPDSDHRRFFL